MGKVINFFLIGFLFLVLVGFYASVIRAQAESLPDLIVESATYDGQWATYTIKNIGSTVYIGDVLTEYIWMDNNNQDVGTVPRSRSDRVSVDLSPGESATENIQVREPYPRSRRIGFHVDYLERIEESNEDNNLFVYPYPDSILALFPNLSVESASLAGRTLTYTFASSGGDYGGGPYVVTPVRILVLNGAGVTISRYDIETAHIPQGSTLTGTYELPYMSPLAARVEVILNPVNYHHEVYRDNNTFVVEVTPDALFDIALGLVEITDSEISFEVINNSTTRYNNTLPIRLNWLSADRNSLGQTSGGYSVDILPGDSFTVTYCCTTFFLRPTGTAYLRVLINQEDDYFHTPELNTTNNTVDYEIPPPPEPDFTPTNAVISDARVDYTIQNVGEGDFTGFVPVNLYWLDSDNNILDGWAAGGYASLPSGGEYSSYIGEGPFTLGRPRNARYLQVVFNAGNFWPIHETNTENNTLLLDAPTVLSPDLTIGETELTHTRVAFTARNIGEGDYLDNPAFLLQWADGGRNVIAGSRSAVGGVAGPVPAGGEVEMVYDRGIFMYSRPDEAQFLKVTVNPEGAFFNEQEVNLDNNVVNLVPTPLEALPDFAIIDGALNEDLSEAQFTIGNTGGRYAGPLAFRQAWLNEAGVEISITADGDFTVFDTEEEHTYTRSGDAFFEGRPETARALKLEVNPAGVNFVEEDNLTNNTLILGFQPDAEPDFTMVRAEFNAEQTGAEYTIGNLGGGYFGPLQINLYWLDEGGNVVGVPQTGGDYVNLNTGDEASYTRQEEGFFYGRPDAARFLKLEVNPAGVNFVDEPNLTNNVMLLEYTLPMLPDLSIQAPVLNVEGVSFEVVNEGGEFYDLLLFVMEWLDSEGEVLDSEIGGTDYVRLNSGDTYPIFHAANDRFLLHPPEGAVTMRLIINPASDIQADESDYGNNTVEIARVSSDADEDELAERDEIYTLYQINFDMFGKSELPRSKYDPNRKISLKTAELIKKANDFTPYELARYSPNVLPGNWRYAFRTIGRELRSFFTFNQERKGELRLSYANEKIIEINQLFDQGAEDLAVKHLSSYEREVNKAAKAVDKLGNKNRDEAEELAERLFDSQLSHMILFGKFERKSSMPNLDEIRQIRNQALVDTAGSINLLDPIKVKKVIRDALESQGSALKSVRNLEVLDAVDAQVSGQTKAVIQETQAKIETRFKSQLDRVSDRQKEVLNEYYFKVIKEMAPEKQLLPTETPAATLTPTTTPILKPAGCTEDEWVCGNWSECGKDGIQSRTCKLVEDCEGVKSSSPAEVQKCIPPTATQTPTPTPTPKFYKK